MLSIRTNLTSLLAQSSLRTSSNKLNQAIERMTTGFKINNAKDNAANYSISTNLSTKIGAYQVAEENTAMGLDMVTTASETLSLIEDKLSRLRALQEQAMNGTYGEDSLKAIRAEANAIVDEIERLYETTQYNGIKLFDKNPSVSSPSKPAVNADGFLQDVTKVDTDALPTLASVNGSTALTSGTYSISTADELVKLAEMTNSRLIGDNTTFVLANDIDLSHIDNWTPIGEYYSFKGDFNGNGYVISNLKINSDKSNLGLFGYTRNSIIKNLGLENVNIKVSNGLVGAFIGEAYETNIYNCYSTGVVFCEGYAAGGLIGVINPNNSSIDYCYSTVSVTAADCAGGLVGVLLCSLTNSYYDGFVNVLATNCCGGIAGAIYTVNVNIGDCYVNIKNKNTGGIFVGYISPGTLGLTVSNSEYRTLNDVNKFVGSNKGGTPVTLNNVILDTSEIVKSSLQIGITSDNSSSIDFNSDFNTSGASVLRLINGSLSKKYYLNYLDSYIAQVSAKQTEFGAVENRLTSALEEIGIKYENLVSTRSTIRDADISEVSSSYIQQQILQQASSTLLATANQSPDLALRLIVNSTL